MSDSDKGGECESLFEKLDAHIRKNIETGKGALPQALKGSAHSSSIGAGESEESGIASKKSASITFDCDSSEFCSAIEKLLSEIAQGSGESIKGFLSGIDSFAELVRIDIDVCAAGTAGNYRIALKPSDLLGKFIATFGATN